MIARRDFLKNIGKGALAIILVPFALKTKGAIAGALVDPKNTMRLSTGHFIEIMASGTRVGYRNHTLHLVRFWRTHADFYAGKPPMHIEDFETQWHMPHPDARGRMKRIFTTYAEHMSGGKLLPLQHWSSLADTHGNLAKIA
jgi:hypothetical protein